MLQNSVFIYLFISLTLIVSLIMFCVRLLSELMIMLSTHHVTNRLTCCNKLQFHLKNMKMQSRDIRKSNYASNYVLIFGKLFYIYKPIRNDLKPRILAASFLAAPLLNNYVSDFFVLWAWSFSRKKRK